MTVLPTCANCGAALNGPYCSNCGQKASDTHRPFWWIFGEFLDSVFGYDSRTFRTLWLLFAEPGEFTRRYNAGQRASLLPPFRLFVIATLVFFLTLQVTGLAIVAFKTQTLSLKDLPPEAVDALKKDSGARITFDDRAGEKLTTVTMEFFVPASAVERAPLTATEKSAMAEADKAIKVDVDGASEEDKDWARWILAKAKRMNEGYVRARADPMALNAPLNIWLPRLMLVLVPVFALLLAVMHWWPRVYLFEHLVFSIHIHTVLFVVLSLAAAAVAFIGSADFLWAVWLILAIYLWMAMYRVYARSWWLTSLKFLVLLMVYSIVLATGFGTIFAIALSEV
jgi:Protein of unknown function (DUF3667)